MLNLNEIPTQEARQEYSLIPDNTIVRAIITLKQGDMQIPDFGAGNWFKASQTTRAKWMEIEFTVIGGPFDKRKFWDRLFVDGDKIGSSGMPEAKEIGLRTLRSLIDSGNGLASTDISPEAQQRRTLSGVADLNGMEICAKIGIKKGTNGYSDTNRLKAALNPKDNGYIPASGGAMLGGVQAGGFAAAAPVAQPTATSSVVPSWANR